MKRILWLVTTLLSLLLVGSLVLVAVLFVVPVEIDATPYKHRIFGLLEDRTGYRVTLDGDLALRFGPRLRIQAGGLHLENFGLAKDRELLSAKRAAAEIDTLALLKGRFLPRELVLADAVLKLRRERDGRSNWAMRHVGEPDGEPSGEVPVVFEPDGLALDLTTVELSYLDRVAGTAFNGMLKRGTVEPSKAGLRLDIDGSSGGSPFRLTGVTALLSQLMDLQRPVPLDLEGQLLGLDLSAKGEIANPYAAAEVDASFSLRAKTLKALAPFIGAELAAKGPLLLETKIKGGAKAVVVDPFVLTLGEQRVSGSAKVDLSGPRPRVDLVGQIAKIDLTPFLDGVGAKADKGRVKDRVFSDEELQWDWMDHADVVAKMEISDLVVPKQTITDLQLDVRLQGRHLTKTLEGKAQGGRSVRAEFSLDASKASPSVELRLKGDELLLDVLVATTPAKDLIHGELDVKAELSASGRSEAEMAASLTGKVLLLIEGAEADVQALDRTIGGSSALLMQMVTPQDKLAKINCGVFAAEFGNGKAEVKGVTDTAHSLIVGYGEIDLKTEQLNVRVDPKGKGVTLSLATPVLVHGSLWNPEYTVLKGELLATLTDLTTRAALPPLLLLDAFGDAVAENPCVAFTAGETPDDGLFKPVESITGGTRQLVRGVGETVVEGTGAVVGGIGGAVVDGGAAVLKGVGDVLRGAVGGSDQAEEQVPAESPEAPGKLPQRADESDKLDKSGETSGKPPEKEENLFLE